MVLRTALAILTHRIPTHLDTVCIMNQPVENTVGQRRIADLFVPARDRQLGKLRMVERN
jgi:hypothetical protein